MTPRRTYRNLFVFALALSVAPSMAAEGDAVPVGQPAELALQPASFSLRGLRARQQLLLTTKYDSGELRDLTHAATFASSNPKVVRIVDSVALPVGDGSATISVQLAGKTAKAEVTVTDTAAPVPVSFKNETLAALTKAGCNMGACHGSPSGKAGFRLSLRGYDPPLDILTLRHEFFGRRTNIMNPEESLILKKPTMQIAHGGGRRLHKGDPAYVVLREWIAEGLQLDRPDVPDLVRIEVLPGRRVLEPIATRQQLIVNGHFSDGSVHDLTALTVFSSSNESVASVSETGLVEKTGRGETAVLARYLDKMDTSYVTFLEDVPGFAWSNPPTNNFVDELVFEKLKQLEILPSEPCTDAEFLRRAYLDATGRLPRIEETRAFLADASPDKRAKLVDHLIDTPDFAAFWTLKWGDILRANEKKLTSTGVFKFRRWLFESIDADQPVDAFARELLTAEGSVFENPPANYWRASRDPQDATETTAQLFLGIRMQCAKCHNHPFERWTQDDYYGIAAAFTRVGRKKSPRKEDEVIFVSPSGEIKQPRTGETMQVHLLLEGDVDVPAGQDRREVFAKWLTSAENPFFAKAAVNRIWGYLMGRGLVEPVDDFRDSNPPSNAKLLDELARQFVEHGFSRKWAVRTIMNSRVYQLSSRKNEFNADDDIYASHASTRLLSAEQLLDAICQVTGVDEKYAGLPPGTRAVELPTPPKDNDFLKVFGQPQREMACQCERSDESNLSQALQMINGPVVHGKLRADNGRIAQMLSQKKSDEEIITTLYLAALCREPSPEELQAAREHIARTLQESTQRKQVPSAKPEKAEADKAALRRQALEDVGWAILNAKEFLFQH